MITVVPTLAFMAEVYRLPREGGPRSPRFASYTSKVATGFGLAAYNPMAGPHALEAVEALLALDAEHLAQDVAADTVRRCAFTGDVTLAVVLCAPGLWTDRVASEVRHRTTGDRTEGRGLVLQWTREVPTADGVRIEAVAETVRVVHGALHGAPRTVRSVLAREGVAYALAGGPLAPLAEAERNALADALDIIGDSPNAGDIVAIAHGDEVAIALGYTPLGLAPLAGVRWACEGARAAVARDAAAAVRQALVAA